MANQLSAKVHFQLRLVKRFDGKTIITHGNLSKPKEGAAKDQTLDFFSDETSALHAAQDYARRGDKRKDLPPNVEFRGVVVVSYESEPVKWLSSPQRISASELEVNNRPPRVKGTATWRYYVSHDGKAYYVNPKTHKITWPVNAL